MSDRQLGIGVSSYEIMNQNGEDDGEPMHSSPERLYPIGDHEETHTTLPKINAYNLEQLIYESSPKKSASGRQQSPSLHGQSKISTTSTILSKLQNRIADFKSKEHGDKNARNAGSYLNEPSMSSASKGPEFMGTE